VRRLPVLAFSALVVATVAAFFVTQHLKVVTPLIQGDPAPFPQVINPITGTTCTVAGKRVDFRSTMFSFYLQHRADDVDVYVVDQSGTIVRTLALGRHMRRNVRVPDGVYNWNGREDNGKFAPDGTYYFRVALLHQGRTIDLRNPPVVVLTSPPRPVVSGVHPQLVPEDGTSVRIDYAGNASRSGQIQIYRTDLPGTPLVWSFGTQWGRQSTVWDGTIAGKPAPAGVYLIGFHVTDAACNTGRFPVVLPPTPGSTPRAGVTVRYLAAQPPMVPVPAGSHASVYMFARGQTYNWWLKLPGRRRAVASGVSADYDLRVPVPAHSPGLYELQLHSGDYRTAVPVVVGAPSRAKLLVVVPALTWQGANPVDTDGDGIPDTLETGGAVPLARPLAGGLPADFADITGLLAYLRRERRPFEVTTDVALIQGVGPRLTGHAAVVLAGDERWVPASLAAALKGYANGGGQILSLGIDALRRGVTVRGGATAMDPTEPATSDIFGASPGTPVTNNSQLINETEDGLGIFTGTSGVLPGFASYQPLTPPSTAVALSEAGVTSNVPAIVGYRYGKGAVVEIGLVGFGSALATSLDAQDLLGRVLTVMAG
jgi:hypothetical protein